MREQLHDNPYEWLETFDRLKSEGHETQCHDDAISRLLGFDDLTEDIWHSITKVNVTIFSQFPKQEPFEQWRERVRSLQTQASRNQVFSANRTFPGNKA